MGGERSNILRFSVVSILGAPFISPSSKFHRDSCNRVREPIRIFIDSIPPPPPPEICDEIGELEIKEPEAPQEMRNKTPDDRDHRGGRRRHRPWARKVISAPMGARGRLFDKCSRGISNKPTATDTCRLSWSVGWL